MEVPGMTIGFVGKAKGLKDVLFERWLLNPANLKSYTNHGTRGGGRRGGRVDEPLEDPGQLRRLQD